MKWRREQKGKLLNLKNIILHHDLSVSTQLCFCIYWYTKHSDKKSNNHQSTDKKSIKTSEDKGLKSPREELLLVLPKDLVFTCWLKVHWCDNQSIIKWQPVMRQNTLRRTKLTSFSVKNFPPQQLFLLQRHMMIHNNPVTTGWTRKSNNHWEKPSDFCFLVVYMHRFPWIPCVYINRF